MKKPFYVYILTNRKRTVLYTGITNDLIYRMYQHEYEPTGFAGKYNCRYLLYYEPYDYVDRAIAREKQIKGWRREKKEKLISATNPRWAFLEIP